MARVAAAVVRLTTGCVAAHHKTTRLAVAGEEEEQLQTQNQNPTQTLQPAHPQLRARAAEEQWVCVACVRRGLATAARESRKALAAPTDPGSATKPASDPEMCMGCCREGGDGDDEV